MSAVEAATGTGKLLHVTFDDAFASVRTALPVLERTGARATVFALHPKSAASSPVPACSWIIIGLPLSRLTRRVR